MDTRATPVKLLAIILGIAVLAAGRNPRDTWGECCFNGQGVSRGEVPIKGPDDGTRDPIEVPCQCSDADPRWYASGQIIQTCLEAKRMGKCWDQFMFGGDADLIPEHYCQITCGRCNCCKSFYDLIQQYGGNEFLSLVDRDGEIKDYLKEVGNTATVLVPSNEAIQNAKKEYGSSLDIKNVLKYHILPPNKYNALWSTPFMALGPEMETMNTNAAPLQSSKFPIPANTTWEGGLSGFTITGAKNSAKVLQSDINACKGYVTFIDSVLIP